MITVTTSTAVPREIHHNSPPNNSYPMGGVIALIIIGVIGAALFKGPKR